MSKHASSTVLLQTAFKGLGYRFIDKSCKKSLFPRKIILNLGIHLLFNKENYVSIKKLI